MSTLWYDSVDSDPTYNNANKQSYEFQGHINTCEDQKQCKKNIRPNTLYRELVTPYTRYMQIGYK